MLTDELEERLARIAHARIVPEEPWEDCPGLHNEHRSLVRELYLAMHRANPVVDVEGMGWQPIETAPKDGAVFDAWCASPSHGFRIADVIWEPRYQAFFSDDAGILADDITHWMPLPAPPAIESLNSQGGVK